MSWKILRSSELSPLRIVAIYLVVSWLWIVATSGVLDALAGDQVPGVTYHAMNSWAFVGLTAFLLHQLCTRMTARLRRQIEECRQANRELHKLVRTVEQAMTAAGHGY